MKHWMMTHTGLVREQNEDTPLVTEEGLFGVADGMGGHNAGEVASGMAVEMLQRDLRGKAPDEDALLAAFSDANRAILSMASQEAAYSGMGTTFSVLWAGKGMAFIGHVGDSRVYRLRHGLLERLTRDHSVVEEWVRQGLITEQEARRHPYRNVITRALGISEEIEVDLLHILLAPGDLFLLCSDGLTGMVEEAEIRRLMVELPPERSIEVLMEQALQAGGRDNITMILLLQDGEVDS